MWDEGICIYGTPGVHNNFMGENIIRKWNCVFGNDINNRENYWIFCKYHKCMGEKKQNINETEENDNTKCVIQPTQ